MLGTCVEIDKSWVILKDRQSIDYRKERLPLFVGINHGTHITVRGFIRATLRSQQARVPHGAIRWIKGLSGDVIAQ